MLKIAYVFKGCNTFSGDRCTFPFTYDGASHDGCIFDGRSIMYSCLAELEPNMYAFQYCDNSCPVECRRGETYMCDSECIPFNEPCQGNCIEGTYFFFVIILTMWALRALSQGSIIKL